MPHTITHFDHALETCLASIQRGDDSLETALDKYPALAEELRPAIEGAMWLEQHQLGLNPRAGWVAASRRRLVGQIARPQTRQPRPSWRAVLQAYIQKNHYALKLTLAVLLVAVLFANTASISAAAKTTFPGDVFYPAKLAQEEIQLALSTTPRGDYELRVSFAQRRLAEMAGVIMEGRTEQLGPSATRFEKELSEIDNLLRQVAVQNLYEARILAEQYQSNVLDQADLLTLFQPYVPYEHRLSLEYVQLTARAARADIKYLLPSGSPSSP